MDQLIQAMEQEKVSGTFLGSGGKQVLHSFDKLLPARFGEAYQ